MRDKDLFQLALGLETPWLVKSIVFNEEKKRIDIYLDFKRGGTFLCPICGKTTKAYDTIE